MKMLTITVGIRNSTKKNRASPEGAPMIWVKPKIKRITKTPNTTSAGTTSTPFTRSMSSPAPNFPGFSRASLIDFLILRILNIMVGFFHVSGTLLRHFIGNMLVFGNNNRKHKIAENPRHNSSENRKREIHDPKEYWINFEILTKTSEHTVENFVCATSIKSFVWFLFHVCSIAKFLALTREAHYYVYIQQYVSLIPYSLRIWIYIHILSFAGYFSIDN